MADQQEKRRLQEELGLPGDKIDEYIAAFEMFDRENRGKLTPDMLKRVLNEEFGQTFSREDIDYMLKQFSEDGDVTFEKFARSLKEKMANPAYDEAFADAFDLLDTDKQGILTKEKLIAGMQKLGENLTDEEADEMLKVASNKDDFVKIMKHGGGMDSIQNASQQNNATAVAASGGGNTASSTATTTPAGGARPRPSGPRPTGGSPRPQPANGSPRPTPAGNGSPRPNAQGAPRPTAGGPRPSPRPAAAPRPARQF